MGFGLCRCIQASPQAGGGRDQSAMTGRMRGAMACRDPRRQRTKRRLSARAACSFLPGHLPVLMRDRRTCNSCSKQHCDAQMFRNDALQQGLASQNLRINYAKTAAWMTFDHGFRCPPNICNKSAGLPDLVSSATMGRRNRQWVQQVGEGTVPQEPDPPP